MKLAALLVCLAPAIALAQFPLPPNALPGSATVAGSESVGGDLSVAGDAGVAGKTTFTGAVTASSTLAVVTDGGFGGNVTVTGTLTEAGGTTALTATGTNTITSGTTAASASATVGAFTFKPTATLDANDLVIDVESAAAAHLFKVDLEGDAVLLGDLTISGTGGLTISGVTGTSVALSIPAATRLSLGGPAGTALLYNNGGVVGMSDLNVSNQGVISGPLYVGTFFIQTPMTLNTCNDPADGRLEIDATGGKTNGKAPKPCICDAQAGKWRNMLNPIATGEGTSTTCPDTL